LHTVRKVQYLEDYKLELHFDDRSVKIVDLENMVKKAKNMFLPLKSMDYFKQVKCDGITISWPNGVDLCPDVLYKMGKEKPHFNRKTKIRKRSKVKSF
jgi:hypothetical protein